MGAPPVTGRPPTSGKRVAVAARVVGLAVAGAVVAVAVPGPVVAVAFPGAVVDVEVGDCAAQFGPEMVLDCSVTAPVCAKARPFKVAPVFMLMDVRAKIFPMNEVVVSRVAELPILHHTLQGSPPVTDEPGEVMRVDTVLKIQTPDPVRFRFPESEKLLVEQ